jgi:ubiquitin carboxyl-terminal hydrolase 7
MDTSQDTSDNPTIILALQRLFYRLQFEEDAVDTKELTKSFGWESTCVLIDADLIRLEKSSPNTMRKNYLVSL